MSKTLWILSEERPKHEVLARILRRFQSKRESPISPSDLEIIPRGTASGQFSFWYDLRGFRSSKIDSVQIRTVGGPSSFVDFLIFLQDSPPEEGDEPILMIEETKTDDEESRNTGVYQRASKFVYADIHFPNCPKVMLYNLKVAQREYQTQTNVFGTKCLSTLGVEIDGKSLDEELNEPFTDLESLIAFKSSMRRPPAGNVPIDITLRGDTLSISGRLFKSGGLSHDPNIGALSMIAATARKLGWDKRIVITEHGLSQSHVKGSNKFIQIAHELDIELKGLRLPQSVTLPAYWHYEVNGEKLASIFVHLVVEQFTPARSIFENHAGSEKGYFITSDHSPIQLEKYVPGVSPRKSIDIPDLIIRDPRKAVVLNVEGKKHQNLQLGVDTLARYGDIERLYIKRYYPKHEIIRTLVLFGGLSKSVSHPKVSFLLNQEGDLVLGPNAPDLLSEAISRLRAYWKRH